MIIEEKTSLLNKTTQGNRPENISLAKVKPLTDESKASLSQVPNATIASEFPKRNAYVMLTRERDTDIGYFKILKQAVLDKTSSTLRHVTNTISGDSGCPYADKNGDLIAVHTGHLPIQRKNIGITFLREDVRKAIKVLEPSAQFPPDQVNVNPTESGNDEIPSFLKSVKSLQRNLLTRSLLENAVSQMIDVIS